MDTLTDRITELLVIQNDTLLEINATIIKIQEVLEQEITELKAL